MVQNWDHSCNDKFPCLNFVFSSLPRCASQRLLDKLQTGDHQSDFAMLSTALILNPQTLLLKVCSLFRLNTHCFTSRLHLEWSIISDHAYISFQHWKSVPASGAGPSSNIPETLTAKCKIVCRYMWPWRHFFSQLQWQEPHFNIFQFSSYICPQITNFCQNLEKCELCYKASNSAKSRNSVHKATFCSEIQFTRVPGPFISPMSCTYIPKWNLSNM